MEISIRTIGNSKGILLPKPLLTQAGLGDSSSAQITLENGCIVLRKPAPGTRLGWGQAAQAVAAAQNDTLLLGEFANADDTDWQW